VAVYKFSNVSGFKNYQQYNDFLAGNPAVIQDNGAYFPLGEFTLASAQSSITFSNIPQTYTHLQVRVLSRYTAGGNVEGGAYFRFNSDTAGNYSEHLLLGTGSAASAQGTANTTEIWGPDTPGAGVTASVFGVSVLDILDYRNTNKYKTTRQLTGYDANGSGLVALSSGSWRSTSAITSITFRATYTSFAINSHFALYGVLA
jgi:hypothetical protein